MKLRSYQEEIAQKIDERFQGKGREARHFVGVKLPTGGGKSFLFLDQFDKLIDSHNQANPTENIFENPKAVISDARVKYYAPLKGILEQTGERVAEYILLDRYISLWKQKYGYQELQSENAQEAFREITNRMIVSCGLKGKKKNQALEEIGKINGEIASEEALKDALESALAVLIDDIDKLVKTEFPKLEFVCYQKDDGKIDESLDLEISEEDEEPELAVFDEAHRNKLNDDDKEQEEQKKTWGEKAKELIRKWKNTRFLAITATPERDADGLDPMQEFADVAGYSVTELRSQDYLASDMSLISALEDGLVVKPEIVSFDCMLDSTQEYREIKDTLAKMMKNPKNTGSLTARIDKESGKYKATDNYHVLLVNFMKMCKLSGKFEFVKSHLQDEELITALTQFENDSYDGQRKDYYQKLEKIFLKIIEIDDVKTDLYQEYETWKKQKVIELVTGMVGSREYLQHGKFICFTPSSDSKDKTASIMLEHKHMMEEYLGTEPENIMLTHSNPKVVSKADDKRNLTRFTMKKDKSTPAQVMVAMDKFNEGLHVDGVVGSFMCRGFIDKSDKVQEDGKEDPRIIFLQQVGRCIHSISPGEVVSEPPVIFDMACNFMRYNEKLNNIFQVSLRQMEFKRIYDESKGLSQTKGKLQVQENPEDEIPKPKILDRILGVMQALAETGIDINSIKSETTWEEVEKMIPEEKREEVLDGIFVMTRKRMKPDYPIGSRIASARAAFWHEERENPKTGGTKKLYNSKTDEFFGKRSFRDLYQLGFFKDLEKSLNLARINTDGFIIGNCATPDKCYGFNVRTGTQYTAGFPDYGIPGVDIKGFSPSGVHKTTGIRYDEHFFRFDRKTNQWKNLFTGKDEDLLGFNHEGICVNPEKGRIGFDRDKMWHKQLEDGSYSVEVFIYDDKGYDAFGFDSQNKAMDGSQYINGFYRVKRRDGSLSYLYKDGTVSNLDGYDIEGFNDKGFNKDGIHRETGCKFNPSGINIDENNLKRPRTRFPLKEILDGTFPPNMEDKAKSQRILQRYLTHWIVLSRVYPEAIESSDWYKAYKKTAEKDIRGKIEKMSQEIRVSQELLAKANVEQIQGLDEELQKQNEENKRLALEKNKKKLEVAKLAEILKKVIDQKGEGGPEL